MYNCTLFIGYCARVYVYITNFQIPNFQIQILEKKSRTSRSPNILFHTKTKSKTNSSQNQNEYFTFQLENEINKQKHNLNVFNSKLLLYIVNI